MMRTSNHTVSKVCVLVCVHSAKCLLLFLQIVHFKFVCNVDFILGKSSYILIVSVVLFSNSILLHLHHRSSAE